MIRRRVVNVIEPAPGRVVEPPTIVQPVVGQQAETEQVVRQVGTQSRVVERPPWSPAQFLAAPAGLVLTIIGGIALARTGTNFSHLALTHAQAAGLWFTALSALLQLIVGIILLGSSVFPDAAKIAMALLGVLLLSWGIVVAADTARLYSVWGYSTGTGILYAIVGGILLIGAAVSPVFFSGRREIVSGEGHRVDRGYGGYGSV